jgi:hypothetical protein
VRDQAHEHEAGVRGEQADLRGERRRRRRVGGAHGPARVRDRQPRDPGGERAGERVDDERRGEAEALGQQAARVGPDAHREEEDALVDRHHAPATRGRADVRQHDLARDEHEGGADAGHEARRHEGREVRRRGAGQVAGGGDEAAEGQRRAPAEHVGQLADRHRDQEAGEAVDGDGDADGRLRHAEGAGVERDHGNDGAEAELVDGDQHAHPHEDARRAGIGHGARIIRGYNPPTD